MLFQLDNVTETNIEIIQYTACHPPRRSGRSAQSEYQPQRRGVRGTAGTAVCTEQQRLREAGGGSRAGCLQTSVETVYRDKEDMNILHTSINLAVLHIIRVVVVPSRA